MNPALVSLGSLLIKACDIGQLIFHKFDESREVLFGLHIRRGIAVKERDSGVVARINGAGGRPKRQPGSEAQRSFELPNHHGTWGCSEQ